MTLIEIHFLSIRWWHLLPEETFLILFCLRPASEQSAKVASTVDSHLCLPCPDVL